MPGRHDARTHGPQPSVRRGLLFKEKRDAERKVALRDLSHLTEEAGGYDREFE